MIQRNAIMSWTHLYPPCEIFLCGDESGTREVAAEIHAKHLAEIDCNDYGTPLLNSVFDQARHLASQSLMCFVNSDIILLNDFIQAVKRIEVGRFLMVGQRWDLDLTESLDFNRPDWEERLRRNVSNHGILHPPAGSDYFVFPRDGDLGELPPFAIGRPGWDNWFIYKARSTCTPVIDVTKVVTVIHQNHGYDHVLERKDETWEGPEADRNRQLIGGSKYVFTLSDVTHILTSKALIPAIGYQHLLRRWQTLPVLVPSTRRIVWFPNRVLTSLKFLHRLVTKQ